MVNRRSDTDLGNVSHSEIFKSRIDVGVRTATLCAVNTLLPVAQTGRPRVDPSAVLAALAALAVGSPLTLSRGLELWTRPEGGALRTG